MSLSALLIEAAARYPDRLAVSSPMGDATYCELDRAVTHLAKGLFATGVRHGDRVVVWDDKSPTAIAAMQAVLRIGAVYIPADGASPPDRVAAIAANCGAKAVCSTRPRPAGMCADTAWFDLAQPVPCDPDAQYHENASADLAYILYTSGSTGSPKGVCISHGNARAFVDWAVQMLRAHPDDRFANHAPLTFDLSVLDVYCAFAVGASVHLVPTELGYAPVQLSHFLHEHAITVWYSVPSALALMIRDGGLLDHPAPASLRAVLFAGEPFSITHVRQLRAWTSARLLNLYGPTETNVCTAHEVTASDLLRDKPVPIGKAACGDKVWAEKPDGTAAEFGEDGELIVDGPTVMVGYWGHQYQQGPFHTGDIVRVLDDGSFDYVGRRDHLVKIRGNRIELGEIEAWIGQHPAVAELVAVVRGSGMDARLILFVVVHDGFELSVLEMKRHSALRLPRYMIPDEVRIVSALPRTQTGKTDRNALPAL
ncbi:AMP-binding protein [Nocardia sp. NPDC051981]|uniref:AMP-binding protein n=1 Tax=Nocardia sp. NPDC051981 TaxID=3155417 RepID=UPI003423EACA